MWVTADIIEVNRKMLLSVGCETHELTDTTFSLWVRFMYFGASNVCYSLRDKTHTANITCSCGVVCYRYISLDSCILLLGTYPLQLISGYSPQSLGFAPSGVHAEFLLDKVTPGHVFLAVFRSSPTSYDAINARYSTIIHWMGSGPITGRCST
jgi:hypothetical protein